MLAVPVEGSIGRLIIICDLYADLPHQVVKVDGSSRSVHVEDGAKVCARPTEESRQVPNEATELGPPVE
jgi:hypothetical protein